jgi:hypothetical protein
MQRKRKNKIMLHAYIKKDSYHSRIKGRSDGVENSPDYHQIGILVNYLPQRFQN